jgi:uncharacterized protein YecE (DUF72 family)
VGRNHHAAGVHVGTSGWTYPDWQGVFYPAGVQGSERLAYYAARFDTLEVNASFYRVPTEVMTRAWNQRLPRGFHLVLKGSRAITHRKELGGRAGFLDFFVERVRPLGCLRVLLWQLPPWLRFDPDRLEAFLERLPARWRHAVEFRHESWWQERTAAVLARHRAAFVAVSHPRLPADVIPTGDLLYARFHGLSPKLYVHDYSERELEEWVRRLAPLLPGRALYAFFNNDWYGHALRNAVRFRELLALARRAGSRAPARRRPNPATGRRKGES